MIAKGLLLIALAGLCACSEGTPKRSAESTADTATAAPPPPPEASDAPIAPLRSNIESPNVGSGPEYVVHGVCPYQCCTYGSSTMISPGTLRASPTFYSDSLARVVAGSRIHTDSGVVIMNPTGLAVVVEETSGFHVGDTLEILNSVREGVHRAKWHGEESEVTTTELGRTAGWLRIIRAPVQYWWIYMTDSTSGKSGWMRMGGVATGVNEPLHADACR